MEPTLVVIGVSCRTAAVAIRERFWIGESRRMEALTSLVESEGIDEILIISNCSRTEFVAWTQDAGQAANSVLRFLTRAYNLKLSEWSSFYRLVDDDAVAHLFRLASGLDATLLGKPVLCASLAQAWQEARKAGVTGRFLDATVQNALAVSSAVQRHIDCRNPDFAVAAAATLAASEKLRNLRRPKIVILGAGPMARSVLHAYSEARLGEIAVLNRNEEKAQRLVGKLGAHAGHLAELRSQLQSADLVIAATSARSSLTRTEVESIMEERGSRPLLMLDLGMPRNIEPAVREIPKVTLLDIDDLCNHPEQRAARQEDLDWGESAVREAVTGFRQALLTEAVLPTLQALRARLDQICRQEVQHLTEEFGPFTEDQSEALQALSAHITQRIAASLARQLKEMPDHDSNKSVLTAALRQLFELEVRESATTVKQ